MYVDPSRRLVDLPAPPTPDEVAAVFPVRLIGFEEQPSLEELSVSQATETRNGRLMAAAASLTYLLWRHPEDRADPRNLRELSVVEAAELELPLPEPAPEWFLRMREASRYPSLWEAVRTTCFPGPLALRTVEEELVAHVNYVVMNVFREERVRGRFPGMLTGAVTERHIERDVPIRLDGSDVPGIRIDTDPHVLGLGADLGDRLLTVVVPRDELPHVRLAFRMRPVQRAEPLSG
ncbi:hypothetical protein [Naasia sp. SYSU D00057]|uniref:hypothetical protein n=1 Tax=Naasia sp. SYSU D00057 TaxID=2817380 RepID=UPI001B316B4A|nr:hypothetical protein [Naasia sp. SYSU D00057]